MRFKLCQKFKIENSVFDKEQGAELAPMVLFGFLNDLVPDKEKKDI